MIRQGGGPAANAAVALARLGCRVTFLGAVGTDALGQEQIEELETEGVITDHVARVEQPSFVAFILVDQESGARTIYSATDERPLLPAGRGLPSDPIDLVITDGWLGPAIRDLVKEARARSIPVLLDAGSFRPEVTELLEDCEIVIASEPFARGFAPGEKLSTAVANLADSGVRLAAVTCGESGVVAREAGEELFHLPAYEVDVIDTTGAGDAFHAGAAWGLAEGVGFREALLRGSAVAALKCREWGARAGLPTRREVLPDGTRLTDLLTPRKLNADV